MGYKGLVFTAALASLMAAAPSAAVPPPPPGQPGLLVLPANQCRVAIAGVVRGYTQPVYLFDLAGPTILRVLAQDPHPALLFDLDLISAAGESRILIDGAGLAGGDVRVGLPVAGRYRLRLLAVASAARRGQPVPFRLALAHAMESGVPECPTPP